MKVRSFASVLLLAVGTPVLAAAPPKPDPSPSFGETLEVNVVNVDVYVTGADGRRIGGLKAGDFTLLEDGKPVQVTNFEAFERAARIPESDAPAAGTAPAAVPPPSSPAAAPDPENQLSLVIFLDNLHLRPEHRAHAVEQIRAFLARNSRPGDRVLLATNDVDLRNRLPFTDDRAALDAALHAAESLPTFGVQADQDRRTAYASMMSEYKIWGCSQEMVQPVLSYAAQAQAEALRTIGALKLTINSLAGIPGRKALLYVSDGLSITPGEELFEAISTICTGKAALQGVPVQTPFERVPVGAGNGTPYEAQQAALDAQKYSVADRLADLTAHANANRVTFYPLQASGIQGGVATDASFDASERILQTHDIQQIQTTNLRGSLTALASDTGGRAILDANDLTPELARMQEDFETYYSLGYTPTHRGDAKMHKVEVKVKRSGLRVRYRQSYRDKPALEKVFDRTLAALYHGMEDNPLGITVEIGAPISGERGQVSVPVSLRIPLFKLAILNQQSSYQGKLRVLVTTRDEEGHASAMRQVEVPLNIPRKEVLNAMGQFYVYTLTLQVKPGPQHVAVAVRDEIAATTSYLSRPLNVAAPPAVAR